MIIIRFIFIQLQHPNAYVWLVKSIEFCASKVYTQQQLHKQNEYLINWNFDPAKIKEEKLCLRIGCRMKLI